MWGMVLSVLKYAAGSEAVRELAVKIVKRVIEKNQAKIDKKVVAIARASGMTTDELKAHIVAGMNNPAGMNQKELDRLRAGNLGVRR